MTYETFLKNTLRSGEYVTDTIRSTQKFQILLTNQRILVIKEIMTRGFLSSTIKSVEMLDDIPLESIVTVACMHALNTANNITRNAPERLRSLKKERLRGIDSTRTVYNEFLIHLQKGGLKFSERKLIDLSTL